MAIEELVDRDWLLLPGTLCTGEVFMPFLDHIGVARSRRRVVALQHPAVEDYRAELDAAAEGTIVCGFSLGAIVAAHLSDSLPAAGLIMFGINPYADDPAKQASRNALQRDVMIHGGAVAMSSRLPSLGGSSPEAARDLILRMANAQHGNIRAQTRLALTRPGALGALSRSKCPVLVLTGDEDQMAPPVLGEAAAAAAPRGCFRLLPGLGHYALLEDPRACAEAILVPEGNP